MYCDYGCGKKFNYILKNGKKCCSSTFYKCNGYKKKLSNSLKKKKKCFKCNKYINISHYKRHIELCGKTVLCKNCNKKIPYYKKFCNTSCAASFNNKIRNRQNSQNKLRQCYISYCKYCNKIIKGKNRKFCNSYCQSKYNKKINTEKWLAGEISGTVMSGGPTNFVREYIYKKFKYKCSKCGWNKIDLKTGKSPLHIHHLDGNRRNNEEYNLDLLCPNCHWLTDTFGGRNQARSL